MIDGQQNASINRNYPPCSVIFSATNDTTPGERASDAMCAFDVRRCHSIQATDSGTRRIRVRRYPSLGRIVAGSEDRSIARNTSGGKLCCFEVAMIFSRHNQKAGDSTTRTLPIQATDDEHREPVSFLAVAASSAAKRACRQAGRQGSKHKL